jgi:hypothetical protein
VDHAVLIALSATLAMIACFMRVGVPRSSTQEHVAAQQAPISHIGVLTREGSIPAALPASAEACLLLVPCDRL